jgi:hypothetical protein
MWIAGMCVCVCVCVCVVKRILSVRVWRGGAEKYVSTFSANQAIHSNRQLP